MKNVLLIIPNLSFGGAQESFSKLSQSLGVHHHVYNVVFNKDEMVNYKLSGALLSLDIPASNNWLSKFFYFIKRLVKLKSIKTKYQIEVSISFLEGADYLNILSKGKDRIILSIRGSKFNDQNITGVLGRIRLSILIPWLYKKADKIVVVTEGIKNEMRGIVSANKIKVVNNGYDFDGIEKKSKELLAVEFRKSPTDKYIVAVGRLSPEKGLNYLLGVLQCINRFHPKIKLIVVGDGMQAPELVQKCESLGLTYDARLIGFGGVDEGQVIFAGYQPNPYPIMLMGTLLSLCSSAEGFPNVLIEAMSLGIPVISTDCPYGPDAILNPTHQVRPQDQLLMAEYGILAPMFSETDSINTWAHGISLILNDADLHQKYSIAARKRALDFTLLNTTTKWLSII